MEARIRMLCPTLTETAISATGLPASGFRIQPVP